MYYISYGANTLKHKILGPIGLILAGGILLAFAFPSYRQGEPSLAGRKATEFNFQLAGQPAHLKDLQGKVVLLDFWASWCPPCLEKAGSLNQLQQDISQRVGVILAISEDENQAAYETFIQENHVNLSTYPDPTTTIN